jgi:chemotaxis protein CheX
MNTMLDAKTLKAVRPDATWPTLLDCAAKEVFKIMVQTDIATMPNSEDGTPTGDTTAMVGLAGALCGVLSIRCTSRTAENITGRMLGSTGAVNSHEVSDAMAEICNMVAGNFKSKITMLAEHCMLSVPMVIRGDDYEMVTIANGQHIALCLEYDKKPIWVCLAAHP